MKIDFTSQEAQELFAVMRQEYDVARVVDPESRRVYDGLDLSHPGEQICHQIWGRCDRCENCTSLQALHTRGRAHKLEICKRHTYWVTSRYMRVEGREVVAEFVTDVTDTLVLDSSRLDEVGNLIRAYNYKLVLDSLTGAYNRRFLDENFLPMLRNYKDPAANVNLAVLDLDHFKSINDTYGHLAGDVLLRDVAGYWRSLFHSRTNGRERLVIRFGGDEFVILAVGSTPEEFRKGVLQYYRDMRKMCYVDAATLVPFGITFGFSASCELPGAFDWQTLFTKADQELYANKAALRAAAKQIETKAREDAGR